ncbi:MAG: hypothetical protein KGJ02_04060 [Verrucomicrobiota bacterium]|nr:hypothetical protein [Verrucomicrobiota bacterium]
MKRESLFEKGTKMVSFTEDPWRSSYADLVERVYKITKEWDVKKADIEVKSAFSSLCHKMEAISLVQDESRGGCCSFSPTNYFTGKKEDKIFALAHKIRMKQI